MNLAMTWWLGLGRNLPWTPPINNYILCFYLQKSFHDKSPYTIMFGPDKCGEDKKVILINSTVAYQLVLLE